MKRVLLLIAVIMAYVMFTVGFRFIDQTDSVKRLSKQTGANFEKNADNLDSTLPIPPPLDPPPPPPGP